LGLSLNLFSLDLLREKIKAYPKGVIFSAPHSEIPEEPEQWTVQCPGAYDFWNQKVSNSMVRFWLDEYGFPYFLIQLDGSEKEFVSATTLGENQYFEKIVHRYLVMAGIDNIYPPAYGVEYRNINAKIFYVFGPQATIIIDDESAESALKRRKTEEPVQAVTRNEPCIEYYSDPIPWEVLPPLCHSRNVYIINPSHLPQVKLPQIKDPTGRF
jgi:hypothetical protein